VRFSPVAPSDGQVVTITVTVLNDGQRNANRVEVQVMDVTNGSPTPIGDIQIIGGISSGGSGVAQVTYDTTGKEGDRKIQVVVDPAGLIAEVNEEDNQTEATLTVGPPADDPTVTPNLVMTSSSVVFTPTQPIPGDLVTMTINVRNDGAVDANNVVVRVMDITDSEPVQVGDDVTIATIAAGETMSATMVYDTTDKQGNRSLTVSADPDNSITESNENDNTATVTIPVGEGGGEPTETPEPTGTAGPTGTPEPTETSEPTGTPEPTGTSEPTETSEPTGTAELTDTPEPTGTPVPEDGAASLDEVDPRQEPPSPGLSVELAEDLNLRD
jgi:uncharacterized repeat protein (TIGR01451 family)